MVVPSRGVLLGNSSPWEHSYHSGWWKDTRLVNSVHHSKFSRLGIYSYMKAALAFTGTSVCA